jgi:hypothetical protein
MSVENEDDLQNNPPNDDDKDPINKIVAEKVEESLKPIKGKLDDAYKKRDEALKKVADLEQRLKDQEIERLQAQGKEKEALELQLAEEKARSETLQRRNTELSRDVEVRSLLNTLPFRNEKAVEIGYREIVSQLKQDENGLWKHVSGKSISEFIETFAQDSENSFLFKVKGNSGGGTNQGGGAPDPNKKKSLFEYSQEELIKLAREGKLRK